jgi:threonyl-tRNA synthetase
MERFVGGLIEHYAGAFPVWLAPEQVRVLPISADLVDQARVVADLMKSRGIRVHLDDRNETLNYRIREAEMMKVPYMAVLGKREAEQGTIALRMRGAGQKQEIVPALEFIDRVTLEISNRVLPTA